MITTRHNQNVCHITNKAIAIGIAMHTGLVCGKCDQPKAMGDRASLDKLLSKQDLYNINLFVKIV